MDIETIRLKFRNNIWLPTFKNIRRRKLKNANFTIISNNCWGGTIYESYGIRKLSPTVGMFIMPDDYLQLIENLDYYLDQPLNFIDPNDSKWKNLLDEKRNWKTYPIARLDNIELHMLHYHDVQIARRKWEARVKRVNRDKMIVKFNDQNGASLSHIKKFAELPIKNKLCFVADERLKVSPDVIYIKQPKRYSGNGIKASYEPFGKSRYIDINRFINRMFLEEK